ncbi:Iron permease FTR1 family protein [Clavispora lusitaniae]|uniref:Iron permease FTR1 family protein n=1 Tax=Clavispora lusitaniae TaxID=36911 RepID=UPI00202C24A6|nr:Iron permease FTR1 family protein [Clavispora lusitaniae]
MYDNVLRAKAIFMIHSFNETAGNQSRDQTFSRSPGLRYSGPCTAPATYAPSAYGPISICHYQNFPHTATFLSPAMSSLEDFFSVQVFFIVLREALESAIIISVLLAFVNKSLQTNETEPQYQSTDNKQHTAQKELRNLKWQIWIGGLCGFLACLVVGAFILAVFYALGSDLWSTTEHYWEGVFSILASVIISAMGVKMLRVNRMQQKWKQKLGDIIDQYNYLDVEASKTWSERNAMFILPFITTLREGLEAIVFVGGIGVNESTSVWAILNATLLGIAIGAIVGIIMYRSGKTLSIQMFMIVSSCFLYLVAAGLFSKGVWNFELQRFIDLCDGFDVSETGHGPGSYDISNSVWHVNCCNGELPEDGVGWMLFTAVFGWTNSATYGSVIGYNCYWIAVIAMFSALLYEEKHGKLPVIPESWQRKRMAKHRQIPLPSSSRESSESVHSTTPLQTKTTS